MSNPVYRNLFSMGTRLDIIYTGIDDEFADSVSMLIKSDLDSLENKISNHIENSPFSLINREAALRPVKIESDLISLVEELKELSEKTEGYYDFAFTGIKPNRVLDDSEFRKV